MKIVAVTIIITASLVAGFIGWFMGWYLLKESPRIQNSPTPSKKCPENNAELHPCYCEPTAADFSLVCHRLDNEHDIISPLRTLRNFDEIRSLRLFDSTFRFFPSNVFRDLKLTNVTIVSSTLTALTDYSDLAFEGLEDVLEVLNLTDTTIQSGWDWSPLKNLSSLRTMYVEKGQISGLDKSEGWGHSELRFVSFVKSGIEFLHQELFRDFSEIVRVSFQGNFIKDVKRTMLPEPALKLESFDISYNKVENFPEDMFSEMPNLKLIDITGNEFLTLNDKVYRQVWDHLIFLNALENYLECDCRILWVVSRRFFIEATCWEPQKLRGRCLRSLKTEELWC